MNQAIAAFILLFCAIFNAVADALMLRFKSVACKGTLCQRLKAEIIIAKFVVSFVGHGKFHDFLFKIIPRWDDLQWAWHLSKWMFYYPLNLAVLWYAKFSTLEIFLLAALSFALWRIVYNGVRREYGD